VTYLEGLVLGVVQGLTEFLPISSSGHLVLTEALLGLTTPGVVVEVVLHVGTLLAVIIVYRARLWDLLRGMLANDGRAWRPIGLLALATVPAAVIGLGFEEFFERSFDSLLIVGVDFLVTGVLLWSVRGRTGGDRRPEPTVWGALGMGLAQALAILPGISRSGSTIVAGIWARVDPVKAAEFSFLMAIPAIAGAAVLQVPELGASAAHVGGGPLLVSFVAALVSGVLAIRLLLALLLAQAFHRFAPYVWILGAGTVAWALWI
jgi:undecaprenyl-diphosphatase